MSHPVFCTPHFKHSVTEIPIHTPSNASDDSNPLMDAEDDEDADAGFVLGGHGQRGQIERMQMQEEVHACRSRLIAVDASCSRVTISQSTSERKRQAANKFFPFNFLITLRAGQANFIQLQ